MTMSEELQRVDVILTRIISPTEFWITIPTDDRNNEPCPYNTTDFSKQKTYRKYLKWIKDRAERKCHLAFLIPIDSMCWTLTAIDKFKVYAKQFEEYAISTPHTVNASTQSTAVILWGLMRQQNDASEIDGNAVWRNINLQMIFQGVARSIVHVKQLSSDFSMPRLDNGIESQNLLISGNQIEQKMCNATNGKILRKRAVQWLPPTQCLLKEFTGTPVFIDDKLTIYVHGWENQECIKFMSDQLTEWHLNRAKNPTKRWYPGDICVAERKSDGMYHRAKIQKVYAKQKQQKCLVQWVDFGYTERVHFKKLSRHIDFVDIPIQVIACHLSNVIRISDDQTAKAKELCHHLIYNQLCVVSIHDNDDAEYGESLACNIQSRNVPLDLSSLLISHGLVQYKPHSYSKFDEATQSQEDFKRIRMKSEEPIQKDSSDLHNYEDFEELYRLHMAINPMDVENGHANDDIDDYDDDSRIFDTFEPPSKRNPWGKKQHKSRSNDWVAAPHLIIDRITEHFKLMSINRSVFECRCVYIVDPVTLLIKLPDMKPLKIDRIDEPPEYCSLEEYSPVIAYKEYAWRRGIVWEKLSTIKHLILFVDTLQISEVHRNCIRKCSAELIGTVLPYAKVHLNRIQPNERIRADDICYMLDEIVMNKDLFAHVFASHDDAAVPKIKLYESEHAKRTIYHSLIKQKFYKRI